MTTITELWTNRADLRQTKTVTRSARELAPGEVLMKIEKVALTANNVSYAVTGDAIGYWRYFPADENWGKAPAWGFAHVVESKSEEIQTGERVWGFLPLASHVVLRPGEVGPNALATRRSIAPPCRRCTTSTCSLARNP